DIALGDHRVDGERVDGRGDHRQQGRRADVEVAGGPELGGQPPVEIELHERGGGQAAGEQIDRRVADRLQVGDVGRVLGLLVVHEQPLASRGRDLAGSVYQRPQTEARIVVADLDPVGDLAAIFDR